ncbi:hypothetical protein BCR35DRAFT_335126 [Leucosporidium creatinivorum]|uniref:Uncharacterized protein n=1 Tax=Leucosporidium creatinivorum TaxID=106004 RepID=A0A1Y2DIG3_9BASI|nr:hypothetical protein BCR35DRAFT_335126 [Leucosporidium creatinivorum]
MPINEQQANEWAGSATADQLTIIKSFRRDGRVTADQCRQLMLVSTGVAHCFVAGGPQPPMFSLPWEPVQGAHWCQEVLKRDERKRQTLDGPQSKSTKLAHKNAAQDPGFLRTFGHERELNVQPLNSHVPFLRLMFDPNISDLMHHYIEEAVGWMLKGGSTRNSFLPLLWVGLRDWSISSAWTRGVVLLYAKEYKERVQAALHHHQQVQDQLMNRLLFDIGLHPDHQLHSLAHFPSLTARQVRRSGVSQRELRERWA